MPPLTERIKKHLHNLFGQPYIWVKMDYVSKTQGVSGEFDYNQVMIRKLAKAGYDVSDPDTAVSQYISDCFIREQAALEPIEPLFNEQDYPLPPPHEDERR